MAGTVWRIRCVGSGYEQDTPLLLADFVTTEAGTGFVHIAPGHGEDDFILGQANGLDIAGDSRRRRHVQPVGAAVRRGPCLQRRRSGLRGADQRRQPAGARLDPPLLPAFVAVQGAADLPGHAAMVHPAGRAGANPREGAGSDRRHAFRAGPGTQPHRLDGRRAARLVRQPPTRLGRADHGVRRKAPPASRCAIPPSWPASPKSSKPRVPTPGMPPRLPASWAPDYDPDDYEQVTDIVDVWFESGCTHAFVLEKRGLPWPADLYLEGSDQHRGWFQSSLLEAVGTRGVAPFKAVVTDGFVNDEQGRKMSKSLGNVVAPEAVAKQVRRRYPAPVGADVRHHRGPAHRPGNPQAAGRTVSPPAQHPPLGAR